MSRANQGQAIELALESNSRLTFVAVADTRPYGELDDEIRSALEDEICWIGRALLAIAADRAHAAGVKAETVLRRGDPLTEIARVAKDVDADWVLIGAPRDALPLPDDDDHVERFAARLQEVSGAQVKVVYAGPTDDVLYGDRPEFPSDDRLPYVEHRPAVPPLEQSPEDAPHEATEDPTGAGRTHDDPPVD